MPQHKSAKKRMKTNLKRQIRNRSAKSILRTALKKYLALDVEGRKVSYSSIQSLLDRASRKGFLHKRKAARLKSRLNP